MRRLSTLSSILGTVSLLLLVLMTPAAYAQSFMPSMMDPSVGGMCPPVSGPCGPPMVMGPCVPGNQCAKINVEGGARAWYTTNLFKLKVDNENDIDLTRDLDLSPNTLLGEIYGAVRMPKVFALTYTFLIPRTDSGDGVLLGNLTVDGTLFPVASNVHTKVEVSRHRWEGEYFVSVGCDSRIGAMVMGELWVRSLRVEDANASRKVSETLFLMGLGGSFEYAPAKGFFIKGKGAFKFLQDQTGWYAEGVGRFFPEMDQGCGGMGTRFRPYGGVGFRWETSNWRINENLKFQTTFYGPFAEVGVVF